MRRTWGCKLRILDRFTLGNTPDECFYILVCRKNTKLDEEPCPIVYFSLSLTDPSPNTGS